MQPEGSVSEEAAFADVLAELMQDRISSPEAVSRFAEVCEDNAIQLRCAFLARSTNACGNLSFEALGLRAKAMTLWQASTPGLLVDLPCGIGQSERSSSRRSLKCWF